MRLSRAPHATLCGLAAILLWSTAAGLIRSLSEHFGAIGGAALMYSAGSILLMLTVGRPRLRTQSKAYLISACILFVGYELSLSLALGYALDGKQAIEVSLINQLWPCFTLLMAIVINQQIVRWPIVPGMALAFLGTLWVLSPEGLSLAQLSANLASNPLSYALALTCALSFALYCNLTKRYAAGENHITLFFILTALTLWVKYAFSAEVLPEPTTAALVNLALTTVSMAGGYALWNIGILGGNLTFLATVSYLAPIFSSAFSAYWLGTSLSWAFWQGAVMVTAGSFICWLATKTPKKA